METVIGFVRIFKEILRAGFYEIRKGTKLVTKFEKPFEQGLYSISFIYLFILLTFGAFFYV